MSKCKTGPKGLCAYLAEVQECDGQAIVPKHYIQLIRKCIEDKIFSENTDHGAICRLDTTSGFSFISYNWDALRKALGILNETRSIEGSIPNPTTCILDIIKAMDAQMEEDSYNEKRILYFASLCSYILDETEITHLADKLVQKEVFLSIILPNKEDMSIIQLENFKVLRKVFRLEKYDEVSCLMSLKGAQIQIFNTQKKKVTRPSPWNCPFEITPDFSISLAGYVCTRVNKVSTMTKVFVKEGLLETPTATSAGSVEERSDGDSSTNGTQATVRNAEEAPLEVEEARRVLEKETFYSTKDDERVEEDEVVDAFFFGDKLLQRDGLSYNSGDKCLKLLAFCPSENINPAFFCGDGTSIFYPRKGDKQAEALFSALLESMLNLKRVAVVRKVYRKGSKCVLGVLSAEKERRCLVLNELFYADDVSIPHFPPLVKCEEDGGELAVGENEDLIDKLIAEKTLKKDFTPFDGPADPAVAALRDKISSKILKGFIKDEESKFIDNIDMFFQDLDIEEDLASMLRRAFPLTQSKRVESRPAGGDLFRKRVLDESLEGEVEKKPRLDEENGDKDASNMDAKAGDEFDDLLDEL